MSFLPWLASKVYPGKITIENINVFSLPFFLWALAQLLFFAINFLPVLWQNGQLSETELAVFLVAQGIHLSLFLLLLWLIVEARLFKRRPHLVHRVRVSSSIALALIVMLYAAWLIFSMAVVGGTVTAFYSTSLNFTAVVIINVLFYWGALRRLEPA